MDYRHICTAGMVAHHDLAIVHEALEENTSGLSMFVVLSRHLILEMGNVADLASISGGLYKDHRELSELHNPIRKNLEFFKYIRNIYVGHFVPDLTEKTFEWMPQTYMAIGSDDVGKQNLVSLFALETAINTYADPETGHKIFSSDTDLAYPPDYRRFCDFMGETVVATLSYLKKLIDVSASYVAIPDFERDMLQLAMTAGKTDFSKLTKGKR